MGIPITFFKISLQLCYVHYYVHSCSKKNIYIYILTYVSVIYQTSKRLMFHTIKAINVAAITVYDKSIQTQLKYLYAKYIVTIYFGFNLFNLIFGASLRHY